MYRIKIYIYLLGISIFNIFTLGAQTGNKENTHYRIAYDFIKGMLEDKTLLSFKNAVFETENAFYDGELNKNDLGEEIEVLVKIANVIFNTELISYENRDKEIVAKHASIFRVVTDSIIIPLDSTHLFVHTPYIYDFDDVLGQRDWSKMFVSKLLETGKGNCHSLPYLYKILSDELNIPCYLSFAPNHIYIKLFAENTGWYNTELTSATFPIDAWIIASGYVNIDAIRNGLYMDTLSTKQSVAHCLVDLAHGYQRKYGKDDPEFVIKCCNTALKYHPANVNAMLTKAESQKYYIHSLMKTQDTENLEDLFSDTSVKEMYTDMENTYVRLHQLGYRRMPEQMYFQWMGLLENKPDRYINTDIR